MLETQAGWTYYKAATPSDTVDEEFVSEEIHVGSAGNMTVVALDDTTCLFAGCLAGHSYKIRCKRVNATGTAASSLVFYHNNVSVREAESEAIQ